MGSYTFPNSPTRSHLPVDSEGAKSSRLLALKILLGLLIIPLRIYGLHRGGEKQFSHQIMIPNYPPDWVTRKKFAAAYRDAYPRNTLVRMAYASTLVDAGRLVEAEHELWLASIDSTAVDAVLGPAKISVFKRLAAVQWREHKWDAARATLAKGCDHPLSSQAPIDWIAPCGTANGPLPVR